MQVILFRHGPAGQRDPARWPDDASRPLTPRGRQRVEEVARGLERLAPPITHVATSPLARASETARLLRAAAGLPKPVVLDPLGPGGGYRRLLDWLRTHDAGSCVLLVGHEPDLGKLAGVMLFGAPASMPLKKAGACSIAFVGEVAPGNGRLQWFLPPRALRRMAKRGSSA